jgi:hypothetical protein
MTAAGEALKLLRALAHAHAHSFTAHSFTAHSFTTHSFTTPALAHRFEISLFLLKWEKMHIKKVVSKRDKNA